MWQNFREKLARKVAPELVLRLELKAATAKSEVEDLVNQRVAKILTTMDPFEPLMRQFRGIFSEEWERPELKLDQKSYVQFIMWAYQQRDDPSFKYFVDWIINTQGIATVTKGNPTPETILFGRAMISAPILLKKEVSRLAVLYEELLKKQRGEEFDSELTVEQ